MDINFQNLSDSLFEELCFDILLDYGFERLTLRSGGADSGRDIQGVKYIGESFVSSYYESWFFECKRYKGSVNQDVLNSKINWADAEQPDHLVFIVSSYLSNNTRTWLEKIAPQKRYRIHIVEGKMLQHIIQSRPNIMRRYFFNAQQDLIDSASKSWVVHNIIPEPELISSLANTTDYSNYGVDGVCFLWCSARIRQDKFDEYMHDSCAINFDPIFTYLKYNETTNNRSLDFLASCCLLYDEQSYSEHDAVYNKVFACELVYLEQGAEKYAIYSFVRSCHGEALEVIVFRDSSLTHKIRYIPENADVEFDMIAKALDIDDVLSNAELQYK